MARLSLTDAERLALADVGVTVEPSGILRGDDGAEVGPGVAAMLLKTDRHPDTGQFVAGRPAGYAAPGDFGMPDPVRVGAPGDFARGYLAAGHAQNSPGNTGRADPPGSPDGAHVAEAADFRRGWIEGQQAESPGTLPPDNPNPGGSPAAQVYAAAAEALTRNVRSADDDRMTPYRAIPDNPPGTPRPIPDQQIPPDLRARAIPSPRATDLTRAAPGETRG